MKTKILVSLLFSTLILTVCGQKPKTTDETIPPPMIVKTCGDQHGLYPESEIPNQIAAIHAEGCRNAEWHLTASGLYFVFGTRLEQ